MIYFLHYLFIHLYYFHESDGVGLGTSRHWPGARARNELNSGGEGREKHRAGSRYETIIPTVTTVEI